MSVVQMTENLTVASFIDAVGGNFRLPGHESACLELTLIEAEAAKFASRPDGSPSFSLIFRGPMQPMLPQGIHCLEHESIGVLDVFMVPIGPDKFGMCYEVIFN